MLKRLFFIALICLIAFLSACCRGKKADMNPVLPTAGQASIVVAEVPASEGVPAEDAQSKEDEVSADDTASSDPAGNNYVALMFMVIIAAIIIGIYLRKKKIL